MFCNPVDARLITLRHLSELKQTHHRGAADREEDVINEEQTKETPPVIHQTPWTWDTVRNGVSVARVHRRTFGGITPPSYRVMELPTQEQDTVYKWDAAGGELFLFPLKVMGRLSQNYSRGKHGRSFTGKSNHPRGGGGEAGNTATEEKVI
ncbi:hypothetical protein EYF80_028947 [Liparis tanakae]|uniref:Uncharacterized protein n=1 Tax=Liparis tanakae TaxID=230148 RepID=A0A4Z2H5S2_9TELE|nr:hypothetical protein EYF80_028947 [Liparis tanakae]